MIPQGVHLRLQELGLHGMIGARAILDDANIAGGDGSTSDPDGLAEFLLIRVLREHQVSHILRHEEGIATRLHSESNFHQLTQRDKAFS